MTPLLQHAFALLEQLPSEQQDAVAQRLLAELEDGTRWDEQFRTTTDDQWDRLAAIVRSDITAGAIVPIEQVFPVRNDGV